jgi:regulator of CtrA degradation
MPEMLTPKVIDGLYHEAMVLAEEARDYFDKAGQWERQQLSPMDRVLFSCESLKVTTRLMHVISWLLVRKAVMAGEMGEHEAQAPDRRLGRATRTDLNDALRMRGLPEQAVVLVQRSQDLYERLARLEGTLAADLGPETGGARALFAQLNASF